MVQIKNLPENHSAYIVARKVEGAYGKKSEYWYYGSYDTEEKAYGVAEEIGGQVFRRPKKGEWLRDYVYDEAYEDEIELYHCSECKYKPYVVEDLKFCPNCGAKMIEEET